MNADALFAHIQSKRSFLCVGLDTDIKRIPECLSAKRDPVFEFNREIIDATAALCVAYKLNTAFYEAQGARGWESMRKTVDYLREKHPEQFIIADAKRGDISNTASMYARSFYEGLRFDAVTIAPYMGRDAVAPFIEYGGKWAILLALTSNQSYDDFQMQPLQPNGRPFYEEVITRSRLWGHEGNIMYVVGATRAELLQRVRELIPDHFLLIPGVGNQGGSLEDVVKYGINRRCGLLVNSSRGIIYADSTKGYQVAAAQKAKELQQQMEKHLKQHDLI